MVVSLGERMKDIETDGQIESIPVLALCKYSCVVVSIKRYVMTPYYLIS